MKEGHIRIVLTLLEAVADLTQWNYCRVSAVNELADMLIVVKRHVIALKQHQQLAVQYSLLTNTMSKSKYFQTPT